MTKVYGSIDTTLKSSIGSSLEDLLGNASHHAIHETENLVSRIVLQDDEKSATIFDDPQANTGSFNAYYTSSSRGFLLMTYITVFLCGILAIILAMCGHDLFSTKEYHDLEHHSFRYIIVGAGPAGLVVGINLANRLQQEAERTNKVPDKVLILESGTESQSDVMKELHILSGTRRGLRPFVTNSDAWSLAGLNKFDIPLMWSRLSVKTDASEYLSHHWPVGQSFLGRAVGGSGLHDAM